MQSNNTGIVVANAPISYGAFEVTVGIDPNVPDGAAILEAVSSAGYAGIDLGPVGYLGDGAELGEGLAAHGLGLTGAYLELPFSDASELDAMMPELDAMLDTFDAISEFQRGLPPKPTIADAGAEHRRNSPGSGQRNPTSGYSPEQWDAFAIGLARVVEHCRKRGYEPTFHHETGTYVESPEEIAKVLEISDIGLCLDSGHFLIGGGDPVEYLRTWADRINHVHLKSASIARFNEVVAEKLPTTAIWEREVFPVLGEGDLDCDAFISTLKDIGYSGWLVVEQDILPQTAERFERAIADQQANRTFLAERGL
ncbi:sugar phosphate isomerase/epimerase family protein [Arthrobacter oryzae]|uniref:2-keto-myo-inositol dehydratase n=1 Tax=Arthrobacter oryzae TaxID=409290 RepID=A0A495EA54_9MICC|nr:sugar phosphate isomerase/epimerase [Arthrobacter oryzae]RKR13798.1 2-keto-myo-inositol dehydratase [Arthrobacter oryzae]